MDSYLDGTFELACSYQHFIKEWYSFLQNLSYLFDFFINASNSTFLIYISLNKENSRIIISVYVAKDHEKGVSSNFSLALPSEKGEATHSNQIKGP